MRTVFRLALAGLLLLPSGRAYAQVDFSGTWVLDRDISSDLAKAMFEPQQSQTSRPGGFSGGIGGFGGRMGSSGRRNPGSSGGGNDSGGRNGAALTVDEHTRLREIADYVRGLSSITIEHTDHSTFTVTDTRGRARLFTTDGKPTEQAFATATIDSTTKWDGPHIVTTYRIGPERDLLFTYILVPATKQMALRITLDQAGRQRTDIPELRLVYKLKTTTTSSPKRD